MERLKVMQRAVAMLELLGVVFVVLAPQIGVALLLTTSLLGRRSMGPNSWGLIWLGAALPVAAVLVLVGDASGLLVLLCVSAGYYLAARLLIPVRRVLSRGLAIGLAVLLVIAVMNQSMTATTWNALPGDNVTLALLERFALGGERLSGSRTRTWRLAGNDDPDSGSSGRPVEVRLQAELHTGTLGWAWALHGPVTVETVEDASVPTARLAFAVSPGDPYAQRHLDTGWPTGGRTFRVEGEMRSDDAPSARPPGCRGVWLQVFGEGGGSSCGKVDPDGAWMIVSHEWTVPSGATSSIIRVVLNDFDGSNIEVRNFVLHEMRNGAATPLGPLWPEGVSVLLTQASGVRVQSVNQVSKHAGFHDLLVSFRVSADRDLPVDVTLSTPPGVTLRIGGADVWTLDGAAMPVRRLVRQSLWFGDPNLLSHGVAMALLLALIVVRRLRGAAAITLMGLVLLLAGGSRVALLAFGTHAPVILALRFSRWRRLILFTSTPIVLVVAALLVSNVTHSVTFGLQLPFNVGERTSRLDIFRFSLEQIAVRPISGLAGTSESFGSLWNTTGRWEEQVQHAHNFFLDMAVRFGVGGLLSAFILTVGLFATAWRRGRWVGMAFVSAAIGLNIFDTTLLTASVLFSLVIGLNSLGTDVPPHERCRT